MAVKPVKNVPTNPYGSLGPSPGTVQKITPVPTAPISSGFGWGSATQANDMSAYGYDKPGTAQNPSTPFTPAVETVQFAQPGHWTTTDWEKMIPGDWEVTDAQAQGNKLQGEAESDFQKALRQAFIDYGGDSGKLGDYAKYIDAPTIEAAQNNKYSATAQNLAAMTKQLRQARAALAGRGMGSSGANTGVTRQALEAREKGDYSALRSFLGGADEGTSGLARTRQQIADRIAEARRSAAARLAQQYAPQWEPGTPEQIITTPASGGSPTIPAPPIAHPSYLTPGKPESAYERALRLRSEAMNRLYGLG